MMNLPLNQILVSSLAMAGARHGPDDGPIATWAYPTHVPPSPDSPLAQQPKPLKQRQGLVKRNRAILVVKEREPQTPSGFERDRRSRQAQDGQYEPRRPTQPGAAVGSWESVGCPPTSVGDYPSSRRRPIRDECCRRERRSAKLPRPRASPPSPPYRAPAPKVRSAGPAF